MQRALGEFYLAEFDSRFGMTLREGVMTQPFDFSDADWVKAFATIDAGGIADPLGGTDAFTFTTVGDAAAQTRFLRDAPQNGRTAPSKHVLYAKKVDLDWIWIQDASAGGGVTWFNIDAGTVGTDTADSSAITAVVGFPGWFKLECTFSITGAQANAQFGVADADGVQGYTDVPGGNDTLFFNYDFTYTDGGGFVPAWAERSGNGIDLVQTVPGDQPLFVANGGPNGVPYLEGDGITQHLENLSLSQGQPTLIWQVCLPTIAGNINKGISDGGTVLHRRLFTNTAAIQIFAGSFFTTPSTITDWQKIRALFNAASSELQVDSDAEATGDVGAGGSSGITVMAAGGGGTPSDQYLARYIMAQGDPPAFRQARVAAILTADYGDPPTP